MTADKYITEINSILRRVEEDAYRRGYAKGQEDKAAEIMDVLNVPAAIASKGNVRIPSLISSGGTALTDRPASERQRAPKGLVPKFVKRVLAEKPGLTPKEILGEASDEYERMIKEPSVRSELRRGEYMSENGRWFLISSEAEGYRTLPGMPSASDDNNGG